MIKKVTTREFSRYFSQYRGEDVDVMSNGEVVGQWRVSDSSGHHIEGVVSDSNVKEVHIKGGVPEKKFKSFFKDKSVNQGIDNL